ncbi:ATPase, T2SS/T4P/T4SS family [Balneolaceae bacterium ANBcel3]|nr:ATPase, T2SS/T4P/T4SS family [Balneolaceae bacterium ANBcel3]
MNINEESRHIFEEFRRKIARFPGRLHGTERQKWLLDVLEMSPLEVRETLREVLEHHLRLMDEVEASDIDLGGAGCHGRIWYRIFGDKKPFPDSPELSMIESDALLLNLLNKDQLEVLFHRRNLDFSYVVTDTDGKQRRFRADLYFDLDHLALNMRRIETEIRPFRGLELHPEIARALSFKYLKYGLTLVTGVTGTGKSTTLDTIIDANNRSVDGHILVVSSPIELVHQPIRCIVRHREVGRDVPTFREGIVQGMRQDPDIIVIGELRDDESIMVALEVTDSGHKTFSTLHTASASESIDRIIGEVPEVQQERVRQRLADVITCVISQKLVPTLDGKRVLAKEVMLATPSVKAAIRNNNVGEIYQMLAEGSQYGMHTLEQDLKRLVKQSVISEEEALNFANNKKRMSELLK